MFCVKLPSNRSEGRLFTFIAVRADACVKAVGSSYNEAAAARTGRTAYRQHGESTDRKLWKFPVSCRFSRTFEGCLLVDLIGIEPMTSSMPWNDQKPKLLTDKQL